MKIRVPNFAQCVASLSILLTVVSVAVGQGQAIDAERLLLQQYVQFSSIDINERPSEFSKLSNETKARFMRLRLALELGTREQLTSEQKQVLMHGVSTIDSTSFESSSRAAEFNQQFELQIKAIFSLKEQVDIFHLKGSRPGDVNNLQKVLDLLSLPNINEQRRCFSNATPDTKRTIWRTKLALHLADKKFDSGINTLFVEALSYMADPNTYTGTENDKLKLNGESFEKRALEVIPKEQVYGLFVALDNEPPKCVRSVPASKLSRSANGKDKQNSPSTIIAEAVEGADCGCYYTTYCELAHDDATCVEGNCRQVNACGVFGRSACTGRCIR